MAEENTSTSEVGSLAVPTTLKNLVEALIFAAPEPVSLKELQAICSENAGEGDAQKIEASEIEIIITELNRECEESDKSYRIVKIAGGYHYATLSEYAAWIGKLYKVQSRRKLSQSSVETLAIIAYKQPITKPDIEVIRGVNCDYVLKTLLEKELVTIVGRAPTVGRPLLYGTTKEFLKHFGLNEITDLPRPREIEELLGDSRYETERRMLEAEEQGAQAKKEDEDFKSRLPHIPRKKPDLDESVKIVPRKKQRELKVTSKESEAETYARIEVEDKGVVKEEVDGTVADAPKSPEIEMKAEKEILQEEPHVPDPVTEIVEIPEAADSREPPAVESREVVEPEIPESLPYSDEQAVEVRPDEQVFDETQASDIAEAVIPASEEPRVLDAVNPEADTVVGVREPVVTSPYAPPNDFEAVHTEITRERSGESDSKPQSKWQTWKEKIQGFIKKLFA